VWSRYGGWWRERGEVVGAWTYAVYQGSDFGGEVRKMAG
jgi:hypothetical protein